MNATATGLPDFGLLLVVKATIILGVAFVSSFLFQRASASARHWFWTLAFAALLLLPGLDYLATESAWRIPISIESSAVLPAPARAIAPPPASLPRSTPPERERSREPAALSLAESSRSWSWSSTLSAVWILGITVFLLRLLIGVVSSHRARRRARELRDPSWLELLDEARERLGVRQEVALRRSDPSQMPMTLGFWKPTILLPKASSRYAPPRRWAVLLHELAHVRRRDCLTQLLSQIACAFYWWHPLVWLAARRMRLLSERASDDLVLDAGARPSDYAHDLLEMARGLARERSTPLASVAMAHRSRFEERLLAILDPKTARSVVSARVALASAGATLAVLLSLALAMPTSASPVASPPAPIPESILRQEPASEARAQEEPRPEEESEPEEEPEPKRVQRPEEPEIEGTRDARARAQKALVEALQDSESSVREQALHALIQIRDERAVPHLEAALRHEDPEMRAKAAWGLGKMRRQEAAGGLASALTDPDAEVREQAAWALGMIRSESGVNALAGALRDSDANVREQAAWALGMIRSGAGVDGLVRALSDEDENVREQAAWALGRIQDERSLEALAGAVRDTSENVREQAVWAIGMLRSSASVDALIEALRDSSPDIRSQAAWALGRIGDARAIEPLSEAVKDEDAEVREQAAWALGRIANGDDGDGNYNYNYNYDYNYNININPPDADVDVDLDPDVDVDPEDPEGDEPSPRFPQGPML